MDPHARAVAATAYPVSPASDLRAAFAWIAFGALVVFASWRMDRLEQQGAQVFTAPGLWPGIVGLVIALLGTLLALRSLRRARVAGWNTHAPDEAELAPQSSFLLAAAMFLVYAILLVGRGLPFWFGTALFVTAYVFVFRRMQRVSGALGGSTRGDALLALTCGLATAAIVSLAFEKLFFVRLP